MFRAPFALDLSGTLARRPIFKGNVRSINEQGRTYGMDTGRGERRVGRHWEMDGVGRLPGRAHRVVRGKPLPPAGGLRDLRRVRGARRVRGLRGGGARRLGGGGRLRGDFVLPPPGERTPPHLRMRSLSGEAEARAEGGGSMFLVPGQDAQKKSKKPSLQPPSPLRCAPRTTRPSATRGAGRCAINAGLVGGGGFPGGVRAAPTVACPSDEG